MDIIISNTNGEPIYEQIVKQIKSQIMNGELKEGDALPSMRSLAQALRISVITTKRAYEELEEGEALPSMRILATELRISFMTTKRAYEELERDGFIESYTGRGSFVKAQNMELLKEEYLKKVEAHLREACDYAKRCEISQEELVSILEMIYGGN